MSTAADHARESEMAILARMLIDEDGQLPEDVARYLLEIKLSERDRARMHDLAVRNQADGLTPGEREELHAFGKATTLLSLLKSRARRTLGLKLETRTDS